MAIALPLLKLTPLCMILILPRPMISNKWKSNLGENMSVCTVSALTLLLFRVILASGSGSSLSFDSSKPTFVRNVELAIKARN